MSEAKADPNAPREGDFDHGLMNDPLPGLESLLSDLGIQNAEFLPDDLSPQVDEQLIKAFASRSLSDREMSEVRTLVLSFRSWYEACLLAASKD